jgi:hypothetical protein
MLVLVSILSRFDTASFSYVIICCTTVNTLYVSAFSLLTMGAGTDWPGSCYVGFWRSGTIKLAAVSWFVFRSVWPRSTVAKHKFAFTNLDEKTLPVVFLGVFRGCFLWHFFLGMPEAAVAGGMCCLSFSQLAVAACWCCVPSFRTVFVQVAAYATSSGEVVCN